MIAFGVNQKHAGGLTRNLAAKEERDFGVEAAQAAFAKLGLPLHADFANVIRRLGQRFHVHEIQFGRLFDVVLKLVHHGLGGGQIAG